MAVFLAGIAASTASAQVPDGATRGPIYITSDLDFTAANGVIGGSGTAESPYIIDGWTIAGDAVNPLFGPGAAGPTAAVEIRDTTAHFVLSNLTVMDPGDFRVGVLFMGLAHGELRSSEIGGFKNPIELRGVADTVVVGNTILGKSSLSEEDSNLGGIFVDRSEDVTVAGNDVSGTLDWGIKLSNSHMVVQDNVIHDTTPAGGSAIQAYAGSARVTGNVVERHGGVVGGFGAIDLDLLENVTVSGNVVRDTTATSRPLISARADVVIAESNQIRNSKGFSEVALGVNTFQTGLVSGNVLEASGALAIHGGVISTHNNSIEAGTSVGMIVSRVQEWASHDDEVSGVTLPSNGAVSSALYASQNGRSQIFNMHIHDNQGIGATFIHGEVEADGIVVERNELGGIAFGGVDGATFRDCTVADNGGIAVRVTADAHGRQSQNVDVACGVDVTVESLEPTSPAGGPPVEGRDSSVGLVGAVLALAVLVVVQRPGRRRQS